MRKSAQPGAALLSSVMKDQLQAAILLRMEMLSGLVFLALVFAAIIGPLWIQRRRTRAFRALAMKFTLRDARFDRYAPDPRISGLFLAAAYPRFFMASSMASRWRPSTTGSGGEEERGSVQA